MEIFHSRKAKKKKEKELEEKRKITSQVESHSPDDGKQNFERWNRSYELRGL